MVIRASDPAALRCLPPVLLFQEANDSPCEFLYPYPQFLIPRHTYLSSVLHRKFRPRCIRGSCDCLSALRVAFLLLVLHDTNAKVLSTRT